jgi:bacteriocin biosynthesis cyclodehydratase domain-containing protein
VSGAAARPVRFRPVQLVPTAQGVIIKRGRMEFSVTGSGAYPLVLAVLDRAARGRSVDEIVASFGPAEEDSARAVIEQLERHRLLIPPGTSEPTEPWETPLDLFHWSAGPAAADAEDRMAKASVTVIGVNEVSKTLVGTLTAAGLSNVQVVNYPFLCNLRMLDESGEVSGAGWPDSLPAPADYAAWSAEEPAGHDCLVATSDFGGLELMRVWNDYCTKRNIPFLPVVLQDLVGYLGPLWVRGQTACFECARARQNANLDDPQTARATEPLAFFGQGVTAAYHPALPAVLGNFAALEVSRLVGGWGRPRTLGTLVEVDLLAPELAARPVLKLPRCPACGESSTRSATEVFRSMLVPPTHEPHR